MPPDSKSVAIIIRRVRGKRIITFEDLLHLDVIISTSTFDWSDWVTKRFEFQRVVDKSHLFATAPSSARLEKTSFAKVSSLRWCVTATPFVPSVAELKKQLVFLFGGFGQYHNYETLSIALRGFSGSKQAFYTLVDALKSNVHGSPYQVAAYQWIAGSCSSSIYDDNHASRCECTRTQVVWSCTLRASSRLALQKMSQVGAKSLYLENSLLFRFGKVDQPSSLTKVNTLVAELRQMRRVEASFRVMIFTQSLHTHRFLTAALKRKGPNTFEFRWSTAAKMRALAI